MTEAAGHRLLGDYEWLGAQLRLAVPDERWFARLDNLLGIHASGLHESAERGEITVVDEALIHSYADQVSFSGLNDLLIWLALTTTDVLAEKRGAFLLHAACFVISGQAVLVFGPPFAGKSSLSVLALARGIPILGDDVIHLAPETGLAEAVPRPLKRRIGEHELRDCLQDPLRVDSPLYGRLDGEPCVLEPRARANIHSPEQRFPVRCSIFLERHPGPGLRTFQPDRFKALTSLLDWARDWSTPTMACANRSARQLLALPYTGLSVGDGEQQAALDAIVELAR